VDGIRVDVQQEEALVLVPRSASLPLRAHHLHYPGNCHLHNGADVKHTTTKKVGMEVGKMRMFGVDTFFKMPSPTIKFSELPTSPVTAAVEVSESVFF
jgi:hypothetical protein